MYFYGWRIFLRSLRIQRAKKHGKRQPWKYALITARMQRWIVDGQHRGAACPLISNRD